MGKGSGRRPAEISQAEWNHRWDSVFASQKPERKEGAPESTPKGLKRPEGKQEDS